MANAFTVDLEDWYQGLTSTNRQPDRWPAFEARLVGSTARLLALLEKHGVQATFFVLGLVAEQYPDLVRQIDDAGHELGVHGYWHQRVDLLTPEHFAAELDQVIQALSPLASQVVVGHRAPYFSIDGQSLWALEVLRERGFRYDSSFFPTRSTLYGYPGAPRFPCRVGDKGGLVEFPVSTARWLGVTWPMGGGFYVRALPYNIIRAGIRQLNRQGQPAILYVHPWELDTEQDYRKVTLRERVSHYYGRHGLEKKLGRLLGEFAFSPLRELVDGVV